VRHLVKLISCSLLCISVDQAFPQKNASTRPVTVTREAGGSVRTQLGFNITLNKNSSLSREWIAIHDSFLPADFPITPGVGTIYDGAGTLRSGEYNYRSSVILEVKEPVAAVEIRFLLFDVWGEHTRTLSATFVEDFEPGGSKSFIPKWNLYSENEASQFYASIAFVARVRTQSGKTFVADYGAVMQEAQKFSRKLTMEDLEPEQRKQP
jgi:hypothetical protein